MFPIDFMLGATNLNPKSVKKKERNSNCKNINKPKDHNGCSPYTSCFNKTHMESQ
jgi:hypothetical protein